VHECKPLVITWRPLCSSTGDVTPGAVVCGECVRVREHRYTMCKQSQNFAPALAGATTARRLRQGLSLVHFSAQPEPFLTLNASLKRLNTPSTPAFNTA